MSKSKEHTEIKSMKITKFRGITGQEVEIGSRLTLISGRNGTGKSTVLGLLAQICGFKKRYSLNKEAGKIVPVENLNQYRTVYGKPFYSDFRSHFKISPKYDRPESNYSVNFEVYDADIHKAIVANLKGVTRTITGGKTELRLVTRQQTKQGTTSRNFIYPTIYLSLGRLSPFVTRKEKLDDAVFSATEVDKFQKYDRNIFNSLTHKDGILSSNNPTRTVSSSVVTGKNYDILSASSGEDNIGQIISAMLSFERLQSKYASYAGGLLLIDELDAGLFPKAQTNLVNVLNHFSAKCNVQVVFTSHSPQIIKQVLTLQAQSALNAKTRGNIGFNYFNDDHLPIQIVSDWSIQKVMSRLNVETPSKLPTKVQVLTEDLETEIALRMLRTSVQSRKYTVVNSKKPIGGDQLLTLAKLKLPDFNKNSVIVLDGDKSIPKGQKNFLNLPFALPPDQLMYHLLAEPNNSSQQFWNNVENWWPRSAFLECPSTKAIMNDLVFQDGKYKQKADLTDASYKHIRDYFKTWFKANEPHLRIQRTNPIFQIWMPKNATSVSSFRSSFDAALTYVISHITFQI